MPLNDENLRRVQDLEKQALHEIQRAIEAQGEDLAALIIEPIQGEGGIITSVANSFRLCEICDRHEILLVFDEVQTGVGLTGRFGLTNILGVRPDILAFWQEDSRSAAFSPRSASTRSAAMCFA
ncbi:MAG: aminotransferase class III-fold pyridoxal phosphate-dependent enzyme [Syntrophotaleaceae bacterium]